jgi:hypothetical protein
MERARIQLILFRLTAGSSRLKPTALINQGKTNWVRMTHRNTQIALTPGYKNERKTEVLIIPSAIPAFIQAEVKTKCEYACKDREFH